MNSSTTDVLIIGAGAAGLMCAIEAGKRGRRVLVIDHAKKPAEKIRISGGGRCNFTNLHVAPERFLSRNSRFSASALSRYTPQDFIALVEQYGIAYHEKTSGQLFCDRSSQQIIEMLLEECRQAGVQIRLHTEVEQISRPDAHFLVRTAREEISCLSLVIACGGLSIPKMGATNLGYQIARQFGLAVVPTRPGLVPFTLTETQLATWSSLAGVATPAEVRYGDRSFREGLLFTHRGLSGPSILQISSYWEPQGCVQINLAPEHDTAALLKRAKATHKVRDAGKVLSEMLPKRLAQRIIEQHASSSDGILLAATPDKQLERLGSALNSWQIVPSGTEGYRTAEVTVGGVDTAELSSKTMESRTVPNLFFIGEVVDVTGHLGGFNFQWAWASGYVAGQYV